MARTIGVTEQATVHPIARPLKVLLELCKEARIDIVGSPSDQPQLQ
ncbi:MAG: hypothetical protein LW720_13200 [Pirellula sp.]|nr:hypothetical protein [Pirellula sp.]